MATLHLLVGPPASGKSTWARTLTARVVCPDALREQRFGGRHDVWQDHRQFAAWRRWSFEEGLSQAKAGLSLGRDVVFDITACLQRERESVLSELGQYAEYRKVHIFRTPLEVCLERNAARDFPVPDQVVRDKYASLWSAPPTAEEGWDRIVLAPVVIHWRTRRFGGGQLGRVEAVFDADLADRLAVVLFPQAWTLEEAVEQAVYFREEMNRVLLGWEFGRVEILSSKSTGACLALQWLGRRQKQELGPLEEEWAGLKAIFPVEEWL